MTDSFVASASRPEVLLDLAARVVVARKWSSEDIHRVARAVYGTPNRAQIAEAMMAIQGDLSSVVSMLDRVLPEWRWQVRNDREDGGPKADVWHGNRLHEAYAKSPACALLAATLRALADATP